ncbi:MAG: cytoplasmic protein [Desulfobacterales bacterium C00003060]|nr:MAG: cytoplasmic protein [Desulfobacterales bacterium S3730MH5]OEU77908.1 MAG: cytoplasmic protein [Desulfobacterales bacterium C00003060]OEU82007.1 MAG: cytoplasmic protein [Desulfobacterales bacterium S5133MH4]
MLKNNLILRNPLRLTGHETEDIIPEGGFGAVLARAGVGKTAFLVQLALNSLLRDNKVLHVSLNDPVKKVCLWYEEVLRNIANQYNVKQIDQLWETILPNRFIMTFKVEGFSVPKLEERLTDLTEQDIFFPRMILVDGFPFDEIARKSLSDLKTLAQNNSIRVWFAVRTHRHEKPGIDGMPPPFLAVADLFEVALQLQPVEKEIRVRALKGETAPADHPVLILDPSTMLIKDKSGATSL